jgi:hypothetical protein
MPKRVIEHKLCDLAFAFLTHNQKTCVRFLPAAAAPGAAAEFVYYYDRGNAPGGESTTVEPLPEEHPMGQEALRGAPSAICALFPSGPPLPGPPHPGPPHPGPPHPGPPHPGPPHPGPPHPGHPPGARIDRQQLRLSDSPGGFVAGLRMGIEQEVIRLRATGSVVPRALILQACEHQAILTLESRAFDAPAIRDVPGLRRWAIDLAVGPIQDLVLRRFEFEATVCWETWSVQRFATQRTAEAILRLECSYRAPHLGGCGARIGMWFGGGGPPPAGVVTGEGDEPPSLYRVPRRTPIIVDGVDRNEPPGSSHQGPPHAHRAA